MTNHRRRMQTRTRRLHSTSPWEHNRRVANRKAICRNDRSIRALTLAYRRIAKAALAFGAAARKLTPGGADHA